MSLEKSYYEIIEMIVCSRGSKVCMIHRCNLCAGIQVVQHFLIQFLRQTQEPEEDFQSDENEELTIDFKQWTTDRTDLLTMKLSLNEFIELLCEKLNKIISHSFVAKLQANYLKYLKQFFCEILQRIIFFWSKTNYKAITGARSNAPFTQL